MASIDLQDEFLLFNEKLYEFNCLPFGLCTAPYVFTKLLKPVAQKLRSEGLLSVIYLDDILLIARSKEEWFILNSSQFTIEVTQEKRQKIYNLARSLKLKAKCRIRELAHCIGVLVAACPGVKYGWLYTKVMERQKFLALEKSKGDYEDYIIISNETKNDLDWWIKNIPHIKNPIRVSHFKLEIYSDASLTGWGAYCQGEKAHGWWNLDERIEHINLLELKAVFNSLKCFAKNLRSCHILLRVDNTTAISYVNRMGGVQYKKLNNTARQIWEWCEARNLWIFASYIKSKDNTIADKESRLLAPETEWEMNEKYFQQIVRNFGNFDIDLFASYTNKKCDRFISWYRDPESLAIDAFTISWANDYFYAFPPFSLVLRVLRKVIDDRADGVIKTPSSSQQTYPGGRELIREAFLKKGVPESGIELMLRSLSSSTIKQYEKPMRLWWLYCKEKDISMFNANATTVIDFLANILPNRTVLDMHPHQRLKGMVSTSTPSVKPLGGQQIPKSSPYFINVRLSIKLITQKRY
ncbi:uncharacterized protein LOC122510567 [Leptopilina heterotoma]|uniref:uncharacterized protein LOC122510567 n=1 Tax=Leptopilina heterotoma TaxID=63436 RepID=UPI001CA9732A|nr:uncharacterized protein LOC122510567 [Leptopilina heterotoma]